MWEKQKYHSRNCRNHSSVITSDITFIVQFSMKCDTDNPTTTEAGSSENRSWLHPPPAAPSHSPDWNVVVDAQHRISGSVNYGRGAVSKKKLDEASALCAPVRRGGRAVSERERRL